MLFSLHTGLRFSEQAGIVWRDINLEQRMLTVVKTKPGKTRHLPLNQIALNALSAIKSSRKASAPVFVNTEGNPVQSVRPWFDSAVESAKIDAYTWHCNRHTFASRLVMAGVDIRTVAYLMHTVQSR